MKEGMKLNTHFNKLNYIMIEFQDIDIKVEYKKIT